MYSGELLGFALSGRVSTDVGLKLRISCPGCGAKEVIEVSTALFGTGQYFSGRFQCHQCGFKTIIIFVTNDNNCYYQVKNAKKLEEIKYKIVGPEKISVKIYR